MNEKNFINSAQEIVPLVNDSPYKRILVIGDMHATYDKLLSLWKKLDVTDEDLVIFLGDYLYGMGDGDKNIETRDYIGKTVIVVGHKSPKKIIPLKVPGRNILMLDTHAKEDGAFSCVDILSGELWQNDTAQIDSILFVCSGNSCRSPMAKYIMRHLLKQNDLSEKILVDSSGCNTYGGSPMSKMAREVLHEKNIPFDIQAVSGVLCN